MPDIYGNDDWYGRSSGQHEAAGAERYNGDARAEALAKLTANSRSSTSSSTFSTSSTTFSSSPDEMSERVTSRRAALQTRMRAAYEKGRENLAPKAKEFAMRFVRGLAKNRTLTMAVGGALGAIGGGFPGAVAGVAAGLAAYEASRMFLKWQANKEQKAQSATAATANQQADRRAGRPQQSQNWSRPLTSDLTTTRSHRHGQEREVSRSRSRSSSAAEVASVAAMRMPDSPAERRSAVSAVSQTHTPGRNAQNARRMTR